MIKYLFYAVIIVLYGLLFYAIIAMLEVLVPIVVVLLIYPLVWVYGRWMVKRAEKEYRQCSLLEYMDTADEEILNDREL